MAQKPMYPGVNNSPLTSLSAAITATTTTINVISVIELPPGPNLVTIGTDDDAEVVWYQAISGMTLVNCERGFDGTIAKAWPQDEIVYRGFTKYDYNALIHNVKELADSKTTRISDRSTDEQYPSAKCVYDVLIDLTMNIHPKYGVSGVGGSAPALTRIWNALGKTTTPGTDIIDCVSDFDDLAPFNRRKCVGTWTAGDGKAVFVPRSYYGDADYAEDGSMGDYVCVDVTPLWWYESADKSVLGVSAGPQTGWSVHPVCLDLDGNIRPHTYLPCYPLGLSLSGRAVSLPGYHNELGSYRSLRDKARTYAGGSLADYTLIEPSAVDHYEYLLQTIEFATQNMQNVMIGATGMRHAADMVSLTANGTNFVVVTSTIGAYFVIGQTIYIGSDYGTSPANVSAYNTITNIQNCDADGTLNESGTFRRITFSGSARDVVAGVTTISSRPWISGVCVGSIASIGSVKGHTGSPISLSSGKYPCMYRWRENPYGNQYMTCLDLMDVRVDEGSEVYHIDWYYLPDPRTYYPSTTSKPDLADLLNPVYGWHKLDTITPNSNYVDGYIKARGNDADYPHVKVPIIIAGGSATTFFCDYAYLVSSHAVRAVRRRGSVTAGAIAGPCFVYAHYAPSSASWYYGGGLFFIQ